MNCIKPHGRKAPELANGQSRANGVNAAGAWVSVYDAALRGVELMAGPVTPRCECASKCRLYPWCCADWHLCGPVCQRHHEQLGVIDFDLGGDAANSPVVNSLRPALFVKAKFVGNLGWPAESLDQLFIGMFIFHGVIKRYV